MLVEVDKLTVIAGCAPTNIRQLGDAGPYIWQMLGTKADVTYVDVGLNWTELLSINPKTEPLEVILREVLAVGELEGGV